jgi:hypothetical protein
MPTTLPRFAIHRGDQRGRTRLPWLDGRHSFSFGRYVDPDRMGYRSLRVLNDDRVAPGGGFGEHGHADMEIITWVLDGVLRHGDSLGHGGDIRPGDVQVMSAGSGIRHSELNPSDRQTVHLLQNWLEPDERGLTPAYRQAAVPPEQRRNQWRLLVSPDGADESLAIHQDARLHVTTLDPGVSLPHDIGAGRHAYLHVARGRIEAFGQTLGEGDAMQFAGTATLSVKADEPSEVLLFDLA